MNLIKFQGNEHKDAHELRRMAEQFFIEYVSYGFGIYDLHYVEVYMSFIMFRERSYHK